MSGPKAIRTAIRHGVGLPVVLLLSLAAVTALAQPFRSATSIDGARFSATGHVTIVNYWATWCAPCREEMPVLDAYYRAHRGEGLAMLAVSLDRGVSNRKLREATAGYAFPIARIDAVKMPRKDIPKALPVTRVYDRTGKLVFATGGDGRSTIDAGTLERVVSPLLDRP